MFLKFSCPAFFGLLGRGGIDGDFFLLEELEVEFIDCDLEAGVDGYSFWLSRSLDELDRRGLFPLLFPWRVL